MIGSGHQACRVPLFQRSKVIFPPGNRMMEYAGSVPRSTRIDPGRANSVLRPPGMNNNLVDRLQPILQIARDRGRLEQVNSLTVSRLRSV